MSVHINSRKAYNESVDKLNKRARRIFAFMQGKPPMTDRQIMTGMCFCEPNAVRPRITEMIKAGLMREACSTKCDITKKTVRKVDVCDPPAESAEQLELM